AQGAAEVALEARHDHQRAIGERFGATAPVGLYDVVIEAAGSDSSLLRAVELARPRGTMVVIGVFGPDVVWPHRPAFVKELRT
ncbi:alcohol dehydrogenase, partial [Klebsiella pneumoniae]